MLIYPRFNLLENEIEYLIYQEILLYFEIISPKPGLKIIEKDPSDDKFIRCARASSSRIIVSGGRHLLALKKYGTIGIISPSQLLKNLSKLITIQG